MFQWMIDGKYVSNGEFLYRTAKFLPQEEWLSLYNAIKRGEEAQIWYISRSKSKTLKDMEDTLS